MAECGKSITGNLPFVHAGRADCAHVYTCALWEIHLAKSSLISRRPGRKSTLLRTSETYLAFVFF
jgi:hypothetical protein